MLTYFLSVLLQIGFAQPFLFRLTDYKVDFTGNAKSWIISPSLKFLPKEDNGQISVSYELVKNGVFSASYVVANALNQQIMVAAAYGHPFSKDNLAGNSKSMIYISTGYGLGQAGQFEHLSKTRDYSFLTQYRHGFLQGGWYRKTPGFGYEVYVKNIMVDYRSLHIKSTLPDFGIATFYNHAPVYIPQGGGRFFFGNRGVTFYTNLLVNLEKRQKYLENWAIYCGVSVHLNKVWTNFFKS